jgi:hypothetical protein
MKKYSYTLLLLILSYLTSSAQIALKGQIVDADTGEKIPFANISTKDNRNTLSNEMGDFSIPVSELPAELSISHLSYGKTNFKIDVNSDYVIRLKATPILLPEVSVGNYARELVSHAAQKLMANFSFKFYGKAIYRQSTQINQQTSEWQEIIYATKSSNSRIEGTAVLKGRFAAQNDVYKFEDFSYFTKAYGLIDLDTNRHAVISLTGSDLYNYSVANLRKEGDREIAEIHFTHKLSALTKSKYGTVFIDTDTYDILKITFITHSDLGVKMKNKHPLWVMKMVNPKFEFEISFKDVAGGRSIEYLKVQYRVDYHLKKEILPIYVSSLTYLYETSTQATAMPYEKANAGGNDREVIKKFAYDTEYWKRNTVIERTPEQNRAILNLEKKGAFGNALGTKKN